MATGSAGSPGGRADSGATWSARLWSGPDGSGRIVDVGSGRGEHRLHQRGPARPRRPGGAGAGGRGADRGPGTRGPDVGKPAGRVADVLGAAAAGLGAAVGARLAAAADRGGGRGRGAVGGRRRGEAQMAERRPGGRPEAGRHPGRAVLGRRRRGGRRRAERRHVGKARCRYRRPACPRRRCWSRGRTSAARRCWPRSCGRSSTGTCAFSADPDPVSSGLLAGVPRGLRDPGPPGPGRAPGRPRAGRPRGGRRSRAAGSWSARPTRRQRPRSRPGDVGVGSVRSG